MEDLNQENNDCSNVQQGTAAVLPPNEDQKENKSIADSIADFFKIMTFGVFKFAFWILPKYIYKTIKALGWKKIVAFLCSIWRALFWFTVWVVVVFAAWLAFGLQQFLRFWAWVGDSIEDMVVGFWHFIANNAGPIWFFIAIIGSVYGLLYMTMKKKHITFKAAVKFIKDAVKFIKRRKVETDDEKSKCEVSEQR